MKTTFWKTLLALLLVLLMICGLLSGCAGNLNAEDTTVSATENTDASETASDDEKIHLRLLADEIDNRLVYLNAAVRQFEKSHENVDIKVELLTSDWTKRSAQVDRLRIEIMAGKGPDIFVLPGRMINSTLESLFVDVEQSMHNGIFADITSYYDADEELDKEAFVTEVMDAGVADDTRYLLPLQYNMPIIYLDEQAVVETGVAVENLASSVDSLFTTLIEKDDTVLGNCNIALLQTNYALDMFPGLLNYSTGEVEVTVDELSDYLRKYQALARLGGRDCDEELLYTPASLSRYVRNGRFWHDAGYPLHIMDMNFALDYMAIAKSQEWELQMYPLRTTDGKTVANVTYWAGINANCENIDVGYEFLRTLLSEKFQFESIVAYRGFKQPKPEDLLTDGWPVRRKGSVEPLWSALAIRVNRVKEYGTLDEIRKDVVNTEVEFSEEDFSILYEPIDVVRFSMDYEREVARQMSTLNEGLHYFETDVDIDKMAKNIIWNLQLHLGEG